ncbi:hypothetical protein Vdis_0963 [Vulcanisaeta distributa DSM 14429]|uniref:Uncharacterized protein n=1 Tax=Vulcanisaeta distributa (strain DSM 14429 / JCM 11212 / NBRC 100878 / IC-017) TaxID=572478 RepID=E1QPQ7_VULDI|nr:hypothetical protein Vdis_0963 [Vulcanisaeta distributa DSM 14429]
MPSLNRGIPSLSQVKNKYSLINKNLNVSAII